MQYTEIYIIEQEEVKIDKYFYIVKENIWNDKYIETKLSNHC